MKSGFWKFFAFIGFSVTVLFILGLIIIGRSLDHLSGTPTISLKKDSILVMDLNGVIMDGKKFLKDLRKYRDKKEVKGVLVRINSPGGVVGPSQEIYEEIKRTREELKKPVVVSISGLAASGGYYAAVAADKIITTPGAILGSIGVIMEFANLEGLYDWAKIKRFNLKTGKFKDAGSEYRTMNPEEKELLQSMIDEVLAQFVKAVADGRKIPEDKVKLIADGRIITGASAVKLGLADEIGTFTDAARIIGEMSGLGNKPELFVPPVERPNPFDVFMSYEDSEEGAKAQAALKVVDSLTMRKLLGQPLYLMPGVAVE